MKLLGENARAAAGVAILGLSLFVLSIAACASDQAATKSPAQAPATKEKAVASPQASPDTRPPASPSPLTRLVASPSPSPGASPGASPSPGGQRVIAGLRFSDRGLQDIRGRSEVAMTVGDFYFEPTFLRGDTGQRVRLQLTNQSDTRHNFTQNEQRIDQDIQPRGTATVEVEFTPGQTVRYYCKFFLDQGMNGLLGTGEAELRPAS